MTARPDPAVGDLLADRYRLLAHEGGDASCERFRARDTRLGRDVLVEIGREAHTATPARGVRSLSGAADTGMHGVLDGGAVSGRAFAVRELAGSAYDDTAAIEVGGITAVMDVPPLPLPPPEPARPFGVGRRRALLAAAGAAALGAVLVVAALAGHGGGSPDLGTTTTTIEQVEASSHGRGTPVTAGPAPTEVPTTTTTAEVTTTLGFPFDDGGPLPPDPRKHDGAKDPKADSGPG